MERMMLPVLLITDAFEPNVSEPANVAAVELEFVKAPLLETPVPFSVKALAVVMVVPFKSNAAPNVTATAPVPRAVELFTFNVPALIDVPPV